MSKNIVKIITLTFIFLLSCKIKAQDESEINYYDQLIEDYVSQVNDYIEPTDAREYEGNYFEKSAEVVEFGTFDFIVIGAGSTGAVLASRLAEISHWRILLLEAGTWENNFTDIPSFYFYSRFSSYNWGFVSEPQTGACQGMIEKRCPFPRGRGLGGTSLINGMIYSRGNHDDFNIWNKLINNGQWSYNDVLPYFMRAENNQIRNLSRTYHGTNGPLPINYHVPLSPQARAFLNAHSYLGLNGNQDINGASQNGASNTPLITRNGRRVSTARAYLSVIPHNLQILEECYATKILISDSTAYGVEFMHGGMKTIARTKQEVIVSAGVFGSPALLMRSGIGDMRKLNELGIDVVQDLPSVGQNLKDHPTFYGMIFESNYTEPIRSRREYIREYLNGYGPYAIAANLQTIGFHTTRLTSDPGIPDIEYLFVPSNSTTDVSQRSYQFTDETYNSIWRGQNRRNTFIVYVALLRPRSSGYITLKNFDPFEYPIVDPNFLTDSNGLDIETLYLGVQNLLRLIDTPPFRAINTRLVNFTFPACEGLKYLSRESWYCKIRQVSMNLYHPLGTCAMKNQDLGGVVDSNLRVYGVQKLRVADASIIPFSISGHPHATAVMIGEKLADIIKDNYQQLNEFAEEHLHHRQQHTFRSG